jgi:hypothetical protein
MTNFSSFDMPAARADVAVMVVISSAPQIVDARLVPMRRSFCRMDAWSFKSKVTSP